MISNESKASEIVLYLRAIEKSTDELKEIVIGLASRLESYARPEEAEVQGERGKGLPAPTTNFGAALYASFASLGISKDMLESLLKRLEV